MKVTTRLAPEIRHLANFRDNLSSYIDILRLAEQLHE